MRGKISDWKDDKGFGFILSPELSGKIFFHITDIRTKEGRPKVHDLVEFEVIQDSQKRLKAKNILIEGLPNRQLQHVNYSNISPLRRTTLDYILTVVLFISVGVSVFIFYKTQNLEKITPFGISALVSAVMLLRKKTPKEKVFTCARCKSIAEFDKRTIQAWSNGFDKIYCSDCHGKWLEAHPQKLINNRQMASGCLGFFMVILLLPILLLASIYQWVH